MKRIKQGGFKRRVAISAAGARSGLGLLSSRASGLLLPREKQRAHNDKALQREAHRFVKQLGELKGAYVKIGQMLALYGEHLLPRAVTDALHTLEAQTTPLDWDVIAEQVGDDLPPLEIDPVPLAAASLAQVHLAQEGDRTLCLKIQYPGIADTIEDDFRNVMQMLALTRWIESGRQLETLTKELKTHLMREVDYDYELSTADRIRELLQADMRFLVPSYYPQFCSDAILAMDYIDGYPVTHAEVQGLSQARRNRLASAMLELFFKETFEWGLMQTDPNFGNFRLVIDPLADHDRIALLDFGAVHALPQSFTDPLRQTILAAHRGETEQTIAGLERLNCLRPTDSETVKTSFAQFCQYILEPFSSDYSNVPNYAVTDDGLYDWRASRLLKRAGKLGSQGVLVKGFAVPPPEFMLMMRKLTGVFTFVSALGAKIDAAPLLQRYADVG